MNLTDRYLQGVRLWLPSGQKDDIVAELSEDLHAQIEEQEAMLGRPLNEPEIAAILQRRGRPFVVANGFLPQRYLIGPLLFPIYLLVLKIIGMVYAVLWLGVLFIPVAAREMPGLVVPAFVSLVVVTIVFSTIERYQAQTGWLAEWNPRQLPEVRNPRLIARGSSAIELVVNLAILSWLTSHPIPFRLAFMAVLLLNVAMASVQLMRPYWTTGRAVLRLVSDVAGSALFGLFINGWPIPQAVPFTIAVGLVVAGFDIYRIVRLQTNSLPYVSGTQSAVSEASRNATPHA